MLTRPLRFGLTTATCAVLYVVFFLLNGALFRALSFVEGVDWIYLPAGLRLCLVLVAPFEGALGIGLASFWIAWDYGRQDPASVAAVTGLISGFAPLLARQVTVLGWGLSPQLERLQGRSLLLLAALFAGTSATLHQVWYAALGRPGLFVDHLAVMFVGDLLGAILLLYAGRWLLARVLLRWPGAVP